MTKMLRFGKSWANKTPNEIIASKAVSLCWDKRDKNDVSNNLAKPESFRVKISPLRKSQILNSRN